MWFHRRFERIYFNRGPLRRAMIKEEPAMAVTKVNEQNFQAEVLESAETVLVDFYADWCGPCKMLSPVVDEIAGEVSGCKVVKLNVDEAPNVAARYNVMSIPTLMVFRQGEAVDRSVGVQSKQHILNMLKG
ncbi:MAG: thioredoxin [Eubacteriales bacterium]|nr:thioredoxin [Eubacteriales bacterium]